MAKNIFLGIKQVTSATTSFDDGYLYFVRTNSGATDGYLRFNGKKYGTSADAEADLKALLGTLPDGFTTFVEYIASAHTAVANEVTARTAADTAIENKIGTGFSATNTVRAEIEALDAAKADKATTLAGYGIIDAYTKTETDGKINDLNATVSGQSTNGDVKVEVKEEKGKLTEVTVTAPNLATQEELENAVALESARTDTKITTEIGKLNMTVVNVGEGETIKSIKEESGVTTVEKQSIKITASQVTGLDDALSGKNVTVETLATPTSGYLKTYSIKQGGTEVGKIDIPKDMVIENAGIVKYDGSASTFTISGTTYDVPTPKPAAGTYMVMIIANKSGNQIWINVKDLVDVYTGGTAITISDTNVVSVNVADETDNAIDAKTTNKNFIKVNDDNELEVKGVDADATVTSADIVCQGGAWADQVKAVFGSTLPSGTTLQAFLQGMLCKEYWGSPTGPTYEFEAGVNKPSITASKSGSQPVGTKVSFSATAGSMTASNSASVAGYTYGYSLNGTSKSSTATSYSATVTSPTQTGSVAISCSVNANLREVDSSVIGTSGATKEYYIMKGTGTYSVSETGKTVARGTVTDQDVYNVSNLTNVRDSDKKSITNAGFIAATSASITPNNSNSASVTGYYPVYYGSSTVVDGDLTGKQPSEVFTEAFIKALANIDKQDVPGTTTKIATAGESVYGGYVVAVPTGHSAYSKTKLNMKATSDASPMGASNNFTTTINMYNNVETVSYKVFYIANAAKDPNAGEWYMTFE